MLEVVEGCNVIIYVYSLFFFGEFVFVWIFFEQGLFGFMYKFYLEGFIIFGVIGVMWWLWCELSELLWWMGVELLNLLWFFNDDNYLVYEMMLLCVVIDGFVEVGVECQEYLLFVCYVVLLVDLFFLVDEQGCYFDFFVVLFCCVSCDEDGFWWFLWVLLEDYCKLVLIVVLVVYFDLVMLQVCSLLVSYENVVF